MRTDEPPAPGASAQDAGRLGPRILSVGELTRVVRDLVRRAAGLQGVWVEGEVGQVTVSSAGHSYFTLKDERAQVRCIIFRDDRLAMPLEPRTGICLVAHGRVDVFEPQGTYQLLRGRPAAGRHRRARAAAGGVEGQARG